MPVASVVTVPAISRAAGGDATDALAGVVGAGGTGTVEGRGAG
jgi:hypothetical protein